MNVLGFYFIKLNAFIKPQLEPPSAGYKKEKFGLLPILSTIVTTKP